MYNNFDCTTGTIVYLYIIIIDRRHFEEIIIKRLTGYTLNCEGRRVTVDDGVSIILPLLCII